MTDLQKEQIKVMRLKGAGYVKIGQALDISHNTIHSFCRRNGLVGDTAKKTVLCQQCGKPIKIIPKVKPKKFCSDSCRIIWWKEHPNNLNKKAVYSFSCDECGKHFTAYGNSTRKYCCHKCYINARFGGKRDTDE